MQDFLKQMVGSGIPEIDWKHIEQDKENIWISQKGEGNYGSNTLTYVIAVHYFKNPDDTLLLPYVMVNLEKRSGGFSLGGATYKFDYYFFDQEGNGNFVGAEGYVKGEGEPLILPKYYQKDEIKIHVGGGDYTQRIRDQLRRIPDSSIVQSIDGFFRDEKGLPEEEVRKLHVGEKTLAHAYNRDSVFYEPLNQIETEEEKNNYSSFSFHCELAQQLVHQLSHFRG